MTDEELKAIEARCDRATPGRWTTGVCGAGLDADDNPVGVYVWRGTRRAIAIAAPDASEVNEQADREFIAAAKQDIPTLLAEVRRLQVDQVQGGKDYCALQDWSDTWQRRALNAEDEVSRLRRAIGHWVRNAREYGAASEADIYKLESTLTAAPAPEPRYSAAAVDALLEATEWLPDPVPVSEDDWIIGVGVYRSDVEKIHAAAAAVRASREQKGGEGT